MKLSCFLLCPLVFIILVAAAVSGCSTQPVWKGRQLSAWVEELNDADPQKAARAETALRHIGTNAIPYLLSSLSSAETPVTEWLETGGRSELRLTGAVIAFRVMGSSAVNALPALGVLLTNQMTTTNVGTAYAVAQSMAGIGGAAEPLLLAALNHPSSNVRRASLVGLIDLGEEAHGAMPFIMEKLNDPEPEVRGLALFFLSDAPGQRDLKLRVFKEASKDPDRQVRSFAEKEFNKLTSN